MSNEMRDLLRGAAASPSGPPDVKGAWKRGRRMRVQRRALSGFAIVAVVALVSLGIAQIVPSGDSSTPPATDAPAPPLSCATLGTTHADIPPWAESANPPWGVPHAVSPDGNVLAVVFGLFSPADARRNNKILWVVKQPRDGKTLVVTASRPGSRTVRVTQPADSGPGEIYPMIIDVPTPGCWHFALAWNGHHSSMNLRYVSSAPNPTTPTVAPTTSTTVPTSGATPTTCASSNLTLTLGPQSGSAGHFNYELQLRNTGTVACTMTGFPGVSFLDAAAQQVGVPAQRNSLPYSTVTIAPGATGYAHLAVVDPSVQNCPSASVHDIRVYPPNEIVSLTVPVSLRVCSSATPGATIDPVLDHSLG